MPSSLTSDRDYLEIVLKSDTTISTSASVDTDAEFYKTVYAGSDYGVETVTHSIGSVPFTRVYYDPAKNGRWYSTLQYDASGYRAYASPWLTTISSTTATKLIINGNASQTDIPVHYRIYRFGDKAFTTDEETDKIFLKSTDSETLGSAASSIAPTSSTNTIAHGGGATALATLEFSEDQSTWYPAGSVLQGAADTSSGPPGGPYAYYYYMTAYASSDSTNVYIYYEHNYSTSKTIYVRYALDYKE